MAEARLLQSNFSAGELSKRVLASGDLTKYAYGLMRAENVIVHPVGGLQKRGGSIWAEDPGVLAAPLRLLSFVRGVGDAVVIVVQRNTLRFIDVSTRHYILSAGVPYQIACPWTDGDLDYLRTWQSGDVLFISDTRRTANVQALARAAVASWSLTPLSYVDGPWLPDAGGTLTAGAVTGAGISLASAGKFQAGHVGALIRMRQNTGSPPYKKWEGNAAVVIGDLRVNGGRVYRATTNGTTGNNSPIHDDGTVSDGVVSWLLVHDGAGVIKITAVADANNATGNVISELPSTASDYWGFSAFSDVSGWPAAGTISQERLALAAPTQTPDTVYLGRTGGYGPDYGDFKPGLGTGLVVDSDAVQRSLANGRVEPIDHVLSLERLYTFSLGGVFAVGGPSLDEPISPAGASARQRSSYGAAAEVAPLAAGDAILFIVRGRQGMREIRRDELETPRLDLVADHISRRGFRQIAFAQAPVAGVACRFDGGSMAWMTYERLENVNAWTRWPMRGTQIESVIAQPRADGRDELWISAVRQVAGAARRSIEIVPPPHDSYQQARELACAVDAAGYFDFWNTNGGNLGRLTILDAPNRRARIEVQVNSFSVGDIGKSFALRLQDAPISGLYEPGDEGQADLAEARRLAAPARLQIDTYVSAKILEGSIVSDGPAELTGAWVLMWARLDRVLNVGARLEGLDVVAFGDGASQDAVTVTGGTATFPHPMARGWCGLPFTVELVDMPIAVGLPNGSSIAARKRLSKVWVIGTDLSIGAEIVSADGSIADPLLMRAADDPNDAPPLPIEGYIAAVSADGWNDHGQVRIRHSKPEPFELQGIVKELST